MMMSGAQAIIKSLELEGVRVLFGYPGAAICPFYDAILTSSIRHVLTRHEQGAAHAASGFARVTGRTGVCVSTSGPGATNLITGIATAYQDSIPLVVITGQVSSELIGKDVFQEADIFGATAPFCKHSYLVKKTGDLPRIIKEAFHIASTGRPGPVVIDIPIDVQTGMLDFEYPEGVDIKGYKPVLKGHQGQLKKVVEAIEGAKNPVICAGGGVNNAYAAENLRLFAEKCGIPVTTTLMGIGSLPGDHPLQLGMIGSHGVYVANYAIHNADLIILMGARVADRAMGSASKIAEKAKIVHIDVDPAEIGKNIPASIPVVGDVRLILQDLLLMAERGDVDAWNETLAKIKKEKQGRKDAVEEAVDAPSGFVKPQALLAKLSRMAGADAILCTEVGQNQIWSANHYKIVKERTFISSGGMGTMGYGLPSAIGAKLGAPEKRVMVVAGDGSFQMNMQELGTIKANNVGVKIILLNNSRLGMVRELQKVRFSGRYSQVVLDQNPDFVKIAQAYGFKAERITQNAEIDSAIERLLADDDTYFLECVVNPDESTLV